MIVVINLPYFLLGGLTVAIFITLFYLYIYRKGRRDLEERNKLLTALRKLDEVMLSSVELEHIVQPLTDSIVTEMKFDMGVLALIDERRGVLRRVAMSNTSAGKEAKRLLPVPYEQIFIPLNHQENLSIKAIKNKQMYIAKSLYELLTPALEKSVCERIERLSGLKTFLTYPVMVRDVPKGVMIISLKREFDSLSLYELDAIKQLIATMGIVLDNARVYQELRDTTKQLAVANNKLRELDRLKDEFVSLASHELRTPLTAISSYLYMVIYKSRDKLPDKTGRYLTRAYLSAGRLISLVNDMLNVSRIESGRIEITPESFNIADLVKEVVEEVNPKAMENKVNVLVLDNKPPQVFADQDKIHQVLLNLIGNALKFTRAGGTITVGFFSDGKIVETVVKDNGVGISKEEQGKLFQKFGRLDSSYLAMGTNGGTGLGLFISKRLVELMSGQLWVSSEGVNKGSTFVFSLPVTTQEILNKSKSLPVKPKDGMAKGLEPVAL